MKTKLFTTFVAAARQSAAFLYARVGGALPRRRYAAFIALPLLALSTLNPQLSTLHAQGTAFTYQGRLNSGTSPANGSYDLTFSLFDVNSGGSAVAGPLATNAVAVSNGLFTVALDFGPGVFNGAEYWLEIGVRTNGGGAFNTLAPRQQLTPSPYAIYAENVTASGISGTHPGGKCWRHVWQPGHVQQRGG